MNCCKLRYMKILGGLRAVPEKPNLTTVLTRTPFMTRIPFSQKLMVLAPVKGYGRLEAGYITRSSRPGDDRS